MKRSKGYKRRMARRKRIKWAIAFRQAQQAIKRLDAEYQRLVDKG